MTFSASTTKMESLRYTLEVVFYAHLNMAEKADNFLSQSSLGRTHHRILYLSNIKPGVEVNELLTILPITKQAMSKSIRHLVKEGYLEQYYSTEDRRIRMQKVTPKGKELLNQVAEIQFDVLSQSHKAMTTEELSLLWDVVEKMIQEKHAVWLPKRPTLEDGDS